MNLIEIATGWALYLKSSEETKERIRKRLEVCDTCEEKEQVPPTGAAIIKTIRNDPKNLFRCHLCKCPLAALASNSKPACRAKKWTL